MPESGSRPRVLLVDDDPTIARLIAHIVDEAGFGTVVHAENGRDALEALEGIDIVLLDHQLPDAKGLDILDAIRARPNPPGVVLITAHGNESLAAAALRRGADDYLAKDPSLTFLLPQILERVRRNRELRKALVAAEQDLVRAERLGAIGEMTVTLHHEINNPLMSASAEVELLLSVGSMSEAQQRESLQAVRESLRRIRDIVRRIGELREVETRTYLPGIRMLNLAASSSPGSPTARGEALLLVPEEDLARVVAMLLRDAGFVVQRCRDLADLETAAARDGVRVAVVMGGSGAAGAHALAGFAPGTPRGYRVVALVAGGVPEPARDAGADAVLQLPFDPHTFTKEMIRLVE
ncbi:MAG TPA: response regulator [Gemmatimonadales bacterium]